MTSHFSTQALILNVGQDSALLNTRTLILQAAGYSVQAACSIHQAIEDFKAADFDLVLLCHSLALQDRSRLVALIRASGSRIPVVTIAGSGQEADPFADVTVESAPEKLFLCISQVMQKAARERSA
jgi:DNA-binding response OmpR family regulator